MVVDAFFYMFTLGAGAASGVGVVAFFGWKVVQFSNRKKKQQRKAVI
ncbi:hypothetical protein GGR02_001396 [Anoxybacillus voinovskiensis]|uniref:Uncharacterized protein n=3 Tax=Anoxybacillaceae TaxID=3120669 RepID=A0A7W8JCP5_9BACL|nr:MULTISPECIES: hypothetical protein [Anoxybacillus]MBB4073634.1 hypothetical protein [Anoxybacillus voinovskiensis]MBB5324913.1 hypothetical protein [Anoxybacillus tepidamans]MBB5354576.1 hypothetical protein [Anoxybacillus mongoliensis]GGJ63384.1 hypothetical protein GCM10008982_10720 [Anoxybacillus voinovskiensis]